MSVDLEVPSVAAESRPINHVPYRSEALDFHLKERGTKGIVQVSPGWTWVVLYAVGVLILAGGLFSVFGRIEVVERGAGILRPGGGVRLLVAQTPGTVVEVLARPGNEVRRGDPVLRIHSPQTQAAILEADQALLDHSLRYIPVAKGQAELYDAQVAIAEDRIRQKEEALESYQRARSRSQERLAGTERLLALGIVGKTDFQNSQENLEAIQRQVAESQHALHQARTEIVALRSQRKQQKWGQSMEEAQARVKREALELSRVQSVISSPEVGVLDGMMARPGDVLQAGMAVAKVVPRDAPLGVVALLPEKDRSFIKEGDTVALELNQYPFFEFGALRGRVVRLGAYLATPSEVQEVLGEGSPLSSQALFRVDIALEEHQTGRIARMRLRPGMLLQARFTLRRRSLLAFVLDPLRKWME
jgi:multidrug resistance efflux pump